MHTVLSVMCLQISPYTSMKIFENSWQIRANIISGVISYKWLPSEQQGQVIILRPSQTIRSLKNS